MADLLDPFDQLPEAADLTGQVRILSYRATYNGSYSCVYRGQLRQDGEMVCFLRLIHPCTP